jgi:hypothetical protein
VTEGANSPKIELFDVVARLEASLAQFSNTLGQRSQAIGYRWFRSLILDGWREQKLVDSWGLIMHAQKDPLLLSTLPAALEGSFDVLIPAFAAQGKADPAKDCFGVSGRRIVVLKRLVSGGIPSQHSHSIMKLLSAKTALALR